MTVTLNTLDGRKVVRCFEGSRCVRKIYFDTLAQQFLLEVEHLTECERAAAANKEAWNKFWEETKVKYAKAFKVMSFLWSGK